MIDPVQLRNLVVRPVLKQLELWSESAENLLMGTAAQESQLGTYIEQIRGPAVGIFQMESATHDDLWKNFLPGQRALLKKLNSLKLADWSSTDKAGQMAGNLYYAMCRIHYWRVKEALPVAADIAGLARYWKRYYNTPRGAGTEQQFMDAYRLRVLS